MGSNSGQAGATPGFPANKNFSHGEKPICYLSQGNLKPFG
jgi:hypothetical protein